MWQITNLRRRAQAAMQKFTGPISHVESLRMICAVKELDAFYGTRLRNVHLSLCRNQQQSIKTEKVIVIPVKNIRQLIPVIALFL